MRIIEITFARDCQEDITHSNPNKEMPLKFLSRPVLQTGNWRNGRASTFPPDNMIFVPNRRTLGADKIKT